MITVAANPRPRLAVVGTGISGLVCAHRLHERFDLTMFEAGDHVGGHTNTVDVALDGETHAIDTGFIVFNEPNYPSFVRLLDELDVASQPSTMSFSVRCDRTGLEYNGTSLNGLFAQRRNLVRPRFLRMIRDILRFGPAARAARAADESVTVGAFLEAGGYGEAFVEHYLLPIGASIWSCPPATFRAFPIRFVADFLQNHRMLDVNGRPQWRVVRGGSRRYVDAMIRPFAGRIRLRAPVRSVRRFNDHVAVISGDGERDTFDHVILACHADQALALLDDPTPVETALLSSFPYQRNEAVLHTDASVLPRQRRARAAWNYRRPRTETDAVSITYDMNVLQSLSSRHRFCVTLNDDDTVDHRKVLRRFVYQHPVYTTGRGAAQARHAEVIDANRTSFCGAYWGYGFHEDGVRSGLAVADALTKTLATAALRVPA